MAAKRSSSRARQRASALADWRGYAETRPVLDHVHSVRELVGKALEGMGLGAMVRESEVIAAWKDVVGDFIAAHSAPSRLRDGVLYVRVLQSSIHFELERELRPRIIAKLKERFGARVVREVRFRLG